VTGGWLKLLRRLGAWRQRRRAARNAGRPRPVSTTCGVCGELTEFGGPLCIRCASQQQPRDLF
jgi:hypothetical protein